MRARYYDPSTGRFISEDPAGLDAGVNLYAYVAGNPISRVDSSGLHFGLAIIGTPVENSFPFNPNPTLVGAVSGGIGGLLGGATACGLGCAAVGVLAGSVAGAFDSSPDATALSSGYTSVVSQSIFTGNIGPSDIIVGGVGIGISSILPGENDIAKNIFSSAVAGSLISPKGGAAGLVGASSASLFSSLLTRGATCKP